MTNQYAQLTFTPGVRRWQSAAGSRDAYAAFDAGPLFNDQLTDREAAFIRARDSLFMASVSETDWPYVQHRGGPVGFMKVLDAHTIGFIDYVGNRQFVSTGNLAHNDRVSLFFMDWANRRRLKLLGRARFVGADEPELLASLQDDDYPVQIERGVLIRVEAYDWNCPQHITPRFTLEEARDRVVPGESSASPSEVTQVPTALGDGPISLIISGIRQLTGRVRAYELRSANGDALPPAPPGSHLRVPVPLADGEVTERHYSISAHNVRDNVYEIAVLNDEYGLGGSRALHERYALGLRLNVDAPINHFPLHDDTRPAVLIAAGIGITPILAMAHALADRGAHTQLHYAGRNEGDMAYRAELVEQFGDQAHVYTKARGERLDVARVLRDAPKGAVFYVCGPDRLLADVLQTAQNLGIADDRVRSERFS